MSRDGTFYFTAALWMVCAGSSPPLELISEMLFSVIGWCKAAGGGELLFCSGTQNAVGSLLRCRGVSSIKRRTRISKTSLLYET